MKNEVGDLVPQSSKQVSPATAEASDFKSPGGAKAGSMSGEGQLVKQSFKQEGPRHTEDGGSLTPAEWGSAGQFKVEMNKGEGGEPSTVIKGSCSVNLATGEHKY